MLRNVIAMALGALGIAACSVEAQDVATEDTGTTQGALVSCGVAGLEWKPFLAHLAYDAAEDFGRWEFTTDLVISGDKLAISSAGYALCASRGRSGCPAMTAGLGAQEGSSEVQNDTGQVIMNPNTIRTQLVAGFLAQQSNEQNLGWIGDGSEAAPYNNFQSPSRTGLPHSVALTNCAATLYSEANYTGNTQCLRTGSYRMADLKIGNDNVSSIKVRSGMAVKLYQHDQFNGSFLSVTGNVSALGSFNNATSSLVVSASDTSVCSAIDTYKVSVSSGDWTKIRAKLVTLGYMRGNDILDVRLDLANGAVEVDPYNVDFVPPSQVSASSTTYGVEVKSATAETWRSTEDPSPSIFPVGAACMKKPYGRTTFYKGIVKSSGTYRYCYLN